VSAAEFRKSAEVLAEEWEPVDDDTAEDVACALALIDLLKESADFYDGLPKQVAARILVLARIINGGAS
jgi:hypothetical protein